MPQTGLFRQLVRHFFDRFFDKESLSPDGDPAAGVIQALGLVAAPGGIVSILVLPLGFGSWELVSFRYQFISYSMAAMAVVMVFEWDALFFDRRDYQFLTLMPIRSATVVFAKLAAIGLFLGMFMAAISFFTVLLWPGVESRGNSLAVAGAHLAVMVAAALFSALAIAALQGMLVTLFRGAVYRFLSVFVQTALMAVSIMLLILSPLLGFSLGDLCRTNSPYLRWFPGFWFAGLYEQLRPAVARIGDLASAGRVLRDTGRLAPVAIWIALAIFVATFLPGYRHHARRVLETPAPAPHGPGRLRQLFNRAIAALVPDPEEYGVFHFIGQTITRSLKHRLFLATYGGLGAAVVVWTLASGGSSLRVSLMLSFILISGLRAAFNYPSDARANWAFQVTETAPAADYASATRKWVAFCAALPLLLALAAIETVRSPLSAAAFHFAFGAVLSLVLIEALFLDFRKVPFTCTHLPGKVNLVFLAVMYVFGFTLYSSYMAALEQWLWTRPAAAGLFFLAIAGGLVSLSRLRKHLVGSNAVLDYEEEDYTTVTTLGLTEQ